jgi:hypothetical protein
MKFILNYVNTKDAEHDLNRMFSSMEALKEFVIEFYPYYTSFQVVVLPG